MLIVAALLSWFLVGLFIRVSKARGWGQPVRKEGSASHLVKEGTPTAGGVPFEALAEAGTLLVEGDLALARRFATLFVLPPKITLPAAAAPPASSSPARPAPRPRTAS